MQSLGKKDQSAQGMIYPAKVLSEMAAYFSCRVQAREDIHEAKKGNAEILRWAKGRGRRIGIRLVKGAYWDSEIAW
ncbi:MAG: proline dehydrogenase family protein, partial [candidate division NC10 bacterium]